MKQKQNVAEGSSSDSTGGEKRGLLERWGDKILQRLNKTSAAEAVVDEPNFTAPPAVNEREKAISDALRNLSQGAAVKTTPARPAAPAPSAPPSQRAQVARPAPAAARPPERKTAAVAGQGSVPPRQGGARHTYVSPVQWRVTPPTLAGAKAAAARVPVLETAGAGPRVETAVVATTKTVPQKVASDVRLSPAEKNKVYERVRNLISTARETATEKTPRKRLNKTLKICFLEDSCTSSHAIREMLGEAGHEVDHFSLAEEALDALKEKEYDLLLASEVEAVGGMDCHGLIRAVRSADQAIKRNLPVIVLTAKGERSNVQSFMSTGANEVIVKPVDGKRLNDQILTVVTVQRMPIRSTKKSFSICFLEDSCTSSHAIREMLGEAGHEVDHFSSAEEALDALNEKNYDVLLASQIVALGGMDCEGLVRTLRGSNNPRVRALPIVVITANSDPSNLEAFYMAGASDVVVKPIEGKELNGRIREVVQVVPAQEITPRARSTYRICFLEDSCTSSHAIREMLGNEGHEVDHFNSAEEALDALMEKDYDVLLSSQIVALGGMDCEGLVKTVRAAKQPAKRALPVVVITANPDPANLESFFHAGANDVIVKPVEGKTLAERIKQAVTAKTEALPFPVPTPAPKNLRVCFLEDSCTSSHAIREMLGEAGHEVDHFSTIEEALDAFLEKDYDILLASQIPTLGGMDTEGLVRAIRSSKKAGRSQKPIAVLTTDASPQNISAFRAAGANDVATKPVKGDLGERLRAVIENRGKSPVVRPQPAAPAPVVVPKHLKICFLEDSCTSSHAIREMLGEAGNEVDHFSSPEEALDAIMEKNYDMLLASQIVALGGLDCEGLITTVRSASQATKRAIPIVGITANADAANLQGMRDAGADEVIVKPIEGNLSERLKGAIRNRAPGGARPKLRAVGPAPAKPALAGPTPKPSAAANAQRTVSKLGQPAGPQAAPKPQAAPTPKGPSLAELLEAKQPAALPAAAPAQRRLMTDRKLIFGMAAMGIVAVVASTWHHFGGEHMPVDLITVEAGPVFEGISAPGRVESKRKVNLTTALPGQITKVNAKEGDKVARGDILATMDDRTAIIELQRAEAHLESATREVALTERTLDRLVRALQMGAVSRQMAEDAEAAVHAARAKQRVAQEEVNAARLSSERLNVTAPFDGTVTVSFAVEGLWAEPPGPLFTIVDMQQREVEVRVAAEDSSRLSVGLPVMLSSDAFPGHAWVEEIVRIAPAASRDSGMTNTVSVYISLGPDAPPLRYGQQVDAQIQTAASNNAVRVPYDAITMRNGRTMVAVIEEDRAHFIPVRTGIESPTHVEVLEGLKPGQKIILLRNKEINEGDHVEPVEIAG